ncbi:hypothetical protein GCM10025780_04340 [Frondihabitans cladoniiphilus]|uniref:Uncharacterized protein n=1 Tax=Frondihabitans cladoniiphilus TaxID=715785 RepID=A0ABP8VKS6_9MICO
MRAVSDAVGIALDGRPIAERDASGSTRAAGDSATKGSSARGTHLPCASAWERAQALPSGAIQTSARPYGALLPRPCRKALRPRDPSRDGAAETAETTQVSPPARTSTSHSSS